ncbi:hypothetical protein CVT26_012413 [Gymnopilus dilepis]|uniref:Uncharacterized protein n=1 Tax=Gymnopilus dilepis TaxID=231916 RepID=A0A409YQJ4_9AGAR|nr:hypothetical protein CVT26_012413 [Gymnopilus dilepis]
MAEIGRQETFKLGGLGKLRHALRQTTISALLSIKSNSSGQKVVISNAEIPRKSDIQPFEGGQPVPSDIVNITKGRTCHTSIPLFSEIAQPSPYKASPDGFDNLTPWQGPLHCEGKLVETLDLLSGFHIAQVDVVDDEEEGLGVV